MATHCVVNMYCGDTYVGGIVADIGSGTIKYGQSGKDSPDAIIPSYLLVDLNGNFKLLDFQYGCINFNSKSGQVNRLVWNPNQLEFNVECACQSLKLLEFQLAGLDLINNELHTSELSRKPLMLCEPNADCKKYREDFTEILFESYGSPGIYFCKSAVLSAISTGRLTALVVDIGSRLNSLAAVVNGRLLSDKSMIECGVAGNFFDFCFAKMVLNGNCGDLLSRNFIARGYDEAILSCCRTPYSDIKNIFIHEQVRELRESIACVSQIKLYNSTIEGLTRKKLSNITHSLPDGTSIDVTDITYSVGELMFNANAELMKEFGMDTQNGHFKGLHTQILDFVNDQIEDTYCKDLIANLYITGGLTSTTGLQERLMNEMSNYMPNDETVMMWTRLKISSPPRSVERSFSSWLGGSILACMPSFHHMWISRQEYLEHGKIVSHRKRC